MTSKQHRQVRQKYRPKPEQQGPDLHAIEYIQKNKRTVGTPRATLIFATICPRSHLPIDPAPLGDLSGSLLTATMSSRAVLDSSPVHIPHPPRPLKRSASTASLPTPPRTHHKKRTTRTHSSDEEDESDDHNHARPISKKPRTSAIAESPEGEDEEAFWLGGSSKPGPRTPTHSPSPPPPALLNYRNRKQNHSLASPPPSTSRNQHQQFVTPPRLERLAVGEDDGGSDGGRRMPVRDSPNNPFLANGSPGTPTPMPVNKNKEVDEKDGERPTLTYVL